LILSPEDELNWLDPDLKIGNIKDLIKPFAETKMNAYTISRNANNPRNNRDVPGIMDRVEYEELEAIS